VAATAEAARLTDAHRRAQARLGAQTVAQALAVWPLLDPADVNGTVQRWLSAMIPIVRSSRRTSARLAANYLVTFRALELGVDVPAMVPVLVEDVPARRVATSLIVTGPAAIRAGVARGVQLEQAAEVGAARSAGAAMRHVLNGGRETVAETVRSDNRSLGWARAVSPSCCAFCAMLASRGPVFSEGTVEFPAHDNCSCGSEPVYRRDADWPSGSRRFQELWQESTRGLSGDDARNAFREALSGDADE